MRAGREPGEGMAAGRMPDSRWAGDGWGLMAREWDVPGYTEVKALGSGGFGEVVLARHDASGAEVAIKYLHRQLLADPGFAALFRAEAAVLALLDDPNVVRLYEYVESPAGAAIVMELVEGVCLREILSRHGQTTPEAALVVLQGSLLGLAAAHRRGVVHRDYKPENVLIDGAGASKLTDFGIAARAGDSPIPAGTLAYAPPEQFGGSPATPASDVYAATATFYECLTGRPPFTGDSMERLLYQHLAEPVPMEPVPGPLRPLMAAGLAKDPGGRPADGAALVAELRAVAGRTYGPGWEDRGRSGLAAAALLLAALWPAGGPPAVQGTAVHWVRLRRRLPHWHSAAVKATAAVGVAVAVAAVVVAAQPKSAGSKAPFIISGSLSGVAAASASSAWAMGCNGTECAKTLILRWNGTTWSEVPSPDLGTTHYIPSVAAASDGSAWAAGCTGCTGASALTTGRTLILRWNGTAWTQVPSPSPGLDPQLMGVTATSADSAWAVGYTSIIGQDGGAFPLILRWNGVNWTQWPNPGPESGYLTGVAAVSASSAWAFGVSERPGVVSTLILRWNGTAWTRVPTPSPGTDSQITGLAVASDDNAWAVGDTFSSTSVTTPLILHWNGTAWTLVPNPSPAGSYLDGVAATSDGTAWAVGYTGTGINRRMLMLGWNGTAWTRVPTPYPGPYAALLGVTAVSSSNVWAVGGTGLEAVILRWNGQRWTDTLGQLSPAAASASSAAVVSAAALRPPPLRPPLRPPPPLRLPLRPPRGPRPEYRRVSRRRRRSQYCWRRAARTGLR